MASIKCGNCKATHGSANEVRECYATKGGNTKVGFKSTARKCNVDKDNLRGFEAKGTPYVPAATTPQWAKANMDTEWSKGKAEFAAREAEQEAEAFMAKMERDQELAGARTVRVAKGRVMVTTVPDGRYAIEEADGTVKFYKVNHGKADGRWAGWVFVDAMASDELWAIKNADRKVAILAAIGNDLEGAMALYGREIGKCGHCGRKLTSEWRKRGIGPICAQKMGW